MKNQIVLVSAFSTLLLNNIKIIKAININNKNIITKNIFIFLLLIIFPSLLYMV